MERLKSIVGKPNFRRKMMGVLNGNVPNVRVQENQNAFDLALNLYGDLEYLYDIIVTNNLSSASTLPVTGTPIFYNNTGYGNELVKKQTRTKKLTYANGQSAGSYNENFNPDFD